MSGSSWDDLWLRVFSAVVMLAIGGICIWLGGLWFTLLTLVVTGGMIWEMIRMGQPEVGASALIAAGMGVLTLGAMWIDPQSLFLPMLAALLVGAIWLGRQLDRWTLVYVLAIWLAGFGLLQLRLEGGLWAMLWLVTVVVASDVAGYFAGRQLGGPKFWPRVSPKKTWSGTIAGWGLAGLVGVFYSSAINGFFGTEGGVGFAIFVSILMGFAGQMGDIAESALKRRAGVKDSSALIPGHGGLLDRFDALIGAALLLSLWSLVAGVV